MAEYLIRKVETCAKCNGEGRYYFPHCRLCGHVFTEAEMASLDNKDHLDCGHSITKLQEETWCEECEGTPRLETWVSLQDALIAVGIVQPEGQ